MAHHYRIYYLQRKSAQRRRAVQLKRRKLSLSLNRKEPCSTERFVFLDNAKAEALNKRYVPKNTEKSTQWALSTFRSWRDKRNDHFREEADKQVPADLLVSTDHAFKLVSPTKSFRRGQVICRWMDCGNMNVLLLNKKKVFQKYLVLAVRMSVA